MISIALCSAKGSPGVTTLSCVLGAVWPRERGVIIAECDPSGGDLAGRFGLSTRIGMTSLVLTQRQQGTRMPDHHGHLQCLPGGLEVLVAPTGADSATALDHQIGMAGTPFTLGGSDLIADCGRLVPGAAGQARMLQSADRVLLVMRPDVAGLAHARWAAGKLKGLSRSTPPSVAVVGPAPFGKREICRALDVDDLHVIPFDPLGARIACGAPGTAKEFVRSDLVTGARRLVDELLGARLSAGVDTQMADDASGPPPESVTSENTQQGGLRPYVTALSSRRRRIRRERADALSE